MRIIKFRAWHKEGRRMHEVAGLRFARLGALKTISTNFHNDHLPVEDYILMQFTGLTDKNGKEIYEGDICLIQGGLVASLLENKKDKLQEIQKKGITKQWLDRMVKEEGAYICVVEWQLDGWTGRGMAYVEKQGEVIGNIYENPEMLKLQDQ